MIGRAPSQRRRAPWLLVPLIAVLAPVLWQTGIGSAQSVAITNTYVTDQPGPAQIPNSHFPSGTSTVYFDYTVDTPSTTDVAEVDVVSSGTTGPYITSSGLSIATTGNKFVALTPGSGLFPDGGYCAFLKINGVPQSTPGDIPIAFTVGTVTYPVTCPLPGPDVGTPTLTPTATPTITPTPLPTNTPTPGPSPTPTPTNTSIPLPPPPVFATPTPTPTSTSTPSPTATATSTPTPTATATPKPPRFPTQVAEEPPHHFVMAISSYLHVRHFGTLRLYFHGTHGKAVSGVSVAIDGRGLGMARRRYGRTNAYGIVTFTYLWPPHGGRLAITGTKLGYATVTVELGVG